MQNSIDYNYVAENKLLLIAPIEERKAHLLIRMARSQSRVRTYWNREKSKRISLLEKVLEIVTDQGPVPMKEIYRGLSNRCKAIDMREVLDYYQQKGVMEFKVEYGNGRPAEVWNVIQH